MSRVLKILFIFVLAVAMIQVVAADTITQGSNASVQIGSLLTWASTTPVDWGKGILFGFFGFVGTLIAIYGFIGGVLPGIEGRKKMVENQEQIDEWTKDLNELIKSQKPENEGLIKATGDQIDRLRDDMTRERWKLFLVGSILYIVIGIAIALLLAQNVLDALIIGAGWASIIGSLGLRQNYTESSSVKNATIDEAMAMIKRLKESPKTIPAVGTLTKGGVSADDGDKVKPQPVSDTIASFERRMRIAKKI